MRQGEQKLFSAVGLGVAAVMLAGCGNIAAAGTSRDTRPATQAAVPSAAAPLKLSDDIRACAGVQGVIGHLTVATTRWSPNSSPFDKAISGQIRVLSVDLYKQAPRAKTRHIQAVVNASARAFAGVATAMTGKSAKDVTRSVEATKVAYRELKAVCHLNQGNE